MHECKVYFWDILTNYRINVKAIYVSWDDINYALRQLFFPCSCTVVQLCLWFTKQLQGLLELHDCLLCTTHWEQDLLVISEAKPWKALQRNHNKTPKEPSKTVQHCAVASVCGQMCSGHWFLILRTICCCFWILLNYFIIKSTALSAHPTLSIIFPCPPVYSLLSVMSVTFCQRPQ